MMSEEEMARRAREGMQVMAVAAGALAQGLRVMGDVLRKMAQQLEQIIETLERETVEEAEDIARHAAEQAGEDEKDVEDDDPEDMAGAEGEPYIPPVIEEGPLGPQRTQSPPSPYDPLS